MGGDARATGRDLAALLLLALAFRLLFLVATPRVLDNADAVHYAETAARLGAPLGIGLGSPLPEGDINPKIPVLYPLLGAVASAAGPDVEWGCRAVSFLASVLTLIPVYLLARGLHGRRAAVIGGVIVALWPWLADYACAVSTEATGALWWVLGAWALLRAARDGDPRTRWTAPLAFAALHFTRPEGTVLLLAAPAAAWWCFRRSGPVYPWLVPYAAVAVTALWASSFYNRAVAGAASANVRVGYIVAEFDVLRFGQTALATLSDVFPVMLGPVLLVFLGVGLMTPRRQPRDLGAEGFVLVLCAVQWGASLFVLSPAPRYLMAPLIVLSLWSARGMDLIMAHAAATGRGRLVRALPVAAIVASMLLSAAATLGAEHLGRRPRQPREYKAAGLWMRANLAPGLVFTRKPQVAWYAGMPSTGPAENDTLAEALARAEAASARYVVVDERYAPPSLRPLLDPAAAPAPLRLLETFDLYPQARVVVYALEAQAP